MTLRELSIRLTGASWRRDFEAKARLSLAWHVALFERQKELPKLEDVIGDREDVKPEHKGKLQRAAWVDWAIAHGIKIEKHSEPVVI